MCARTVPVIEKFGTVKPLPAVKPVKAPDFSALMHPRSPILKSIDWPSTQQKLQLVFLIKDAVNQHEQAGRCVGACDRGRT